MSYYGGGPQHRIIHSSQLLQHQQLQLQLQHPHHLQPNHRRRGDDLAKAYPPPATGDETTASVEPELYCSAGRDQYYDQFSSAVQYYTQNTASTSITVKRLEDVDHI